MKLCSEVLWKKAEHKALGSKCKERRDAAILNTGHKAKQGSLDAGSHGTGREGRRPDPLLIHVLEPVVALGPGSVPRSRGYGGGGISHAQTLQSPQSVQSPVCFGSLACQIACCYLAAENAVRLAAQEGGLPRNVALSGRNEPPRASCQLRCESKVERARSARSPRGRRLIFSSPAFHTLEIFSERQALEKSLKAAEARSPREPRVRVTLRASGPPGLRAS